MNKLHSTGLNLIAQSLKKTQKQTKSFVIFDYQGEIFRWENVEQTTPSTLQTF